MGAFTKVSSVLAVANGNHYAFFCQGCGYVHVLPTGPGDGARWGFNGNADKPTFTPSVLVRTGQGIDPKLGWEEGDLPRICHSFVTDGKIQFLNDCDHKYAGETLDLPDWDEAMNRVEA